MADKLLSIISFCVFVVIDFVVALHPYNSCLDNGQQITNI